MWSGFGESSCDLWKSAFRHRRDCSGHDRKQFAGSHSDEREKMFDRFVLALRFRRQFAEMLHHGVWINLADGTDFAFVFALEFLFAFHFLFAEQAASDVAESAQPAFAFEAGLVLRLVLALTFHLAFEFSFELVFEFRQSFQFTFVCRLLSSYKKWSTVAGGYVCTIRAYAKHCGGGRPARGCDCGYGSGVCKRG